MTFTSMIVFAGALFIAAGTPGPSIAALVARVISKGTRGVFPFLFGMWVGDAVWLTVAVAGLSAIAETFNHVFIAIKWLGVVYLLYLAWKMWTASPDTSEAQLPEARSSLKLFLAALSVALGNPKIMMFYIALLPSIIDIHAITTLGWVELVACQFLVLMTVNISWMLLAGKARGFLKSRRAVRIANRVSAGAMASAAAAIATR
ncbi:threonine/homoserine/homoserine lactone efflux protein [Neorhizobium sp. 2083]|uniref:LysE family translocator n=1 Tax=Neorhizobium sp. 2083 TaxID=2817762 RepID=UPI002860A74E|nr:LysE family translocator [Neorhizobium sp. 2083]MDR6816237.1 threonine/homoserine/homoserine lactone efflux protein [Neorhizobium sp. 2083]